MIQYIINIPQISIFAINGELQLIYNKRLISYLVIYNKVL